MSRAVPFAANTLLQVKLPAYRSRMLMFLIALAFLALAGRAAYLQLMTHDFLQRQGESRYGRTIELPASRGKIVDRQGRVLASSLPARAIWASPEDLEATPERIAELARVLDMPLRQVQARLADEDKTFVYLKRQVDLSVAERVAALGITGIYERKEYKRHYPEAEALAHVVGFTNVEDVGQEGMELAQEKTLAGLPGSRRVIKDRLGRIVEDVGIVREPHDGRELQLSVDSKIQYQVMGALRSAVEEHRAKAGAAVVLDVRTGEILALANLPTYNPNQRGQLTGAQLRNRVITDTFEPGSTMKPFTTALALENGKVTPQTIINTAPGRLTIGPNTIGDAHPHGALTVEQVLQKSSNVGTVKMALTMPPQKMWEMFTAVGFGQAPQIGFPGAVAGRVRPYKNWKPIEQATMSYGHGISVSLIQLARAYLVFARDGDIPPLTMLRTDGPASGMQVISPKTARAVRKMLEMAAGPGGTAPQAQIVGYRVAGKTGTAHKQEGGRYVRKYVASFVGFAPVSDPRVVIAVMIDEPTAGKYYGGLVAAPVFAQIAGESLRALRVAPDAPLTGQIVPIDPVPESF
ncbi:MAG TPA: penicillin-binding protein 2 [Quisquiliibacterium sp.]|nr:penicillin-binding protein 2 [Quisquiliibacterium sp.]HPA90590.1 penicillin-binding protein 2 [Quisquiliibacterium sp.]HQN12278.1 penicillin-binding protein 2 [Quisquiliibacterium sp.]HQP65487.1 penicillin-binding protein 2 [Quisquiliibacterium sp.]